MATQTRLDWWQRARQWSRDGSSVEVERDADSGHFYIVQRAPEGIRYGVAGPFGTKESAEKCVPVWVRYLRAVGRIN